MGCFDTLSDESLDTIEATRPEMRGLRGIDVPVRFENAIVGTIRYAELVDGCLSCFDVGIVCLILSFLIPYWLLLLLPRDRSCLVRLFFKPWRDDCGSTSVIMYSYRCTRSLANKVAGTATVWNMSSGRLLFLPRVEKAG